MREIAITNNPKVRDETPRDKAQKRKIEFYDTDYLGILKLVRDRIHLGHGLLTHPLSGSIKPGETPYKTVVISAGKSSFDTEALRIIEDSIQTCLKLTAKGMEKSWNAEILSDFQLIDYDLIFG